MYQQSLSFFQEGDIKWTVPTTVIIALVAVAAGMVSALVGIGGGMILGPVMLELGILPDIVAATSSFMIVSAPTKAHAHVYNHIHKHSRKRTSEH